MHVGFTHFGAFAVDLVLIVLPRSMSLPCPNPRAAAAILLMMLLLDAAKAQSVADGAPTGLHVIWVSVPGDCILATSGAPSRVSWGHETLEACQAPLALPPPRPPSPPPSSPPPSPPPPASAAAGLASAAVRPGLVD